MADRYCPNCGTEVEADARFCPSCGTTLDTDPDPGIPAAPPWPDAPADEPTLTDAPIAAAPRAGEPEPLPLEPEPPVAEPVSAEPPLPEPEPEPTVAPAPLPDATAPRPAPLEAPTSHPASPPATRGTPDLPFTWPTTLSGWLIGGGSLAGAVFLLPRLTAAGTSVSWLLLLALLGVAATVFLPDRIPDIPRLRLWILVTTTIGLGVALARAAFTIQGLDTLFLVAMLAAAGGALLIELDMDRPFPPPDRQG